MTKKFDLIVVGGGILGTFHAFHALNAGLKVLLLEKDNYPVGATVRNFGQVVPSGMEGKWFEFGVKGLGVYRELQQKFDISVRNNGSVYIASDPDEQQLLHELKAHYDTVGYDCELLTKKEIGQKYPAIRSSYAREALYFPQEISVEPGRMILRVHEYMKQHFPGFQLMYDSPVTDCTEGSAGVEVAVSGNRKFISEKVVICNGNEFKLLFPDIFARSGQKVSKLQMMRTSPMPAIDLEGNILTGLTIRRYESFAKYCPSFKSIPVPDHYRELQEHGIHVLFKKAVDGSFVIGDSHHYADVTRTDDLGYDLDEHVNDLILREASRIADFDVSAITARWAGFYPQHPDNIVEITVSDHVFIRTAIGGKGMTAGIAYAQDSIERICTGDAPVSL
ncbi:TIGR03364 family FAD-dependent oxidoreductase [Sinomicrobium weinanense]|uniref:TIGR03364 family FAD-dependent oxidoreductase n=1 Tax=Sinomicrobium weinanense TaxID=2842200 RepID=A0A926JUG4_9FLAO|nr:TIGR03364 family FAD-dependent oxidoreductase [Sinomicrobium weinanense]MBC9797760.1 TIGR03364 family FAD-dependent oxidoreductase [Sinomicrobium weinanense]MBU3122421.1 TIGR03364 family FAD-dependent oxidoreductase [Sinomicrobium weinanense]